MQIVDINFKAVIFDLDGTLYSNKGIALKMILRGIGNLSLLKASRKVRSDLKGTDLNNKQEFYRVMYEKMSAKVNKDVHEIDDWYINSFYPVMVKLLKDKFKKRSNLDEVLNKLKDKSIPAALLSDYSLIKERLKALDIDEDYFMVISSSEDEGALKPASRLFLDIAEKMGISPEHILVVGDRSDTDGEGAHLVNMPFVKISEKTDKKNKNSLTWQEFSVEILRNI